MRLAASGRPTCVREPLGAAPAVCDLAASKLTHSLTAQVDALKEQLRQQALVIEELTRMLEASGELSARGQPVLSPRRSVRPQVRRLLLFYRYL